jgi:hypothetical protein
MGEIKCLSCDSSVDSLVDGGSSFATTQQRFLGPASRQKFMQDGRIAERERIIKLLREDRKCQHGNDCTTMVNIDAIIKSDLGIDIEKLIKGE